MIGINIHKNNKYKNKAFAGEYWAVYKENNNIYKIKVTCDVNKENNKATFIKNIFKNYNKLEEIEKKEYKYYNGMIKDDKLVTELTPEEKTRSILVCDSIQRQFKKYFDEL